LLGPAIADSSQERLRRPAYFPPRIALGSERLLGSWEKEVLMAEATTKQHWPCQVRSETEHPCPHQAAVEIQGIPFCEPCAREQEAYFAMGELVE
jgi:hypothetical protein